MLFFKIIPKVKFHKKRSQPPKSLFSKIQKRHSEKSELLTIVPNFQSKIFKTKDFRPKSIFYDISKKPFLRYKLMEKLF